MSSPPVSPSTAPTPVSPAVRAILDMARPVVTLLPIDCPPDAFARELQRQSLPPCR